MQDTKISKKFIVLLIVFSLTNNIYVNATQTSSNTQKGDINFDGKINNEDIQLLEKYLIGLENFAEEQKANSDIYEDNKINLVDLHYLVKKINNNQIGDNTNNKYNFEQITPEDSKVTYEPILMANEKMKQYGITGAGSQWPVSLESSNDGSLMLYGIDVAGLFKST